jgi:hypothetical protein
MILPEEKVIDLFKVDKTFLTRSVAEMHIQIEVDGRSVEF